MFSHFWTLESPSSGFWQGLVPGENSLPGLQKATSLFSSPQERRALSNIPQTSLAYCLSPP